MIMHLFDLAIVAASLKNLKLSNEISCILVF